MLAAAVLLYDWTLTFPDEVRMMWTRPTNGAKIMFLLLRYSLIIYYIVQMLCDHIWEVSNKVSFVCCIEVIDIHYFAI